MTKSQLTERIAEQFALSKDQAEEAVNIVLGRISTALADGERVELRDFGVFEVRHRRARDARNPRTGDAVQVPEKLAVHFKAGKALKARVDN
ncbi:HU family DNA-binding protein [Magnetofaba australis]|uniref:HU family DNA-binding protein n=1 Tax=Magnetofaba australis TaxID=1472297 RepID=UPI000A19BC79|nr:HU family DNA-binding protein [Magnetofaba australis]